MQLFIAKLTGFIFEAASLELFEGTPDLYESDPQLSHNRLLLLLSKSR